MSTRVVKHCVCDRCGALGDAPAVTGMPAGWASVQSTFGYHLCPTCLERALAVNEPAAAASAEDDA